MNIDKHREAIDRIDEKIVHLLNERTLHVLEIGKSKIQEGKEIYAPHREKLVLDRLCGFNKGPVPNDALLAIYREIMSCALVLEKPMEIAYLGPEATFTHQAAIKKFGHSLSYASQKTIGDVFRQVSQRKAEYGVVPVENSTEGVVTHTLDMFVDSDLKIVAQIILPIHYCLGTKTLKQQVKKLFAHPQALAQCRNWVQINLPNAEIIETSSNSRSAQMAAKEKFSAAITSSLAAEFYQLNKREDNLQDSTTNATRFLVLGRKCTPVSGNDRTSMIISVKDKIGALYHALIPFSRFKINLTKIESRPSKRKPWEYLFFVDFEGHMEDAKVRKALKYFEENCSFVKILGSYPNLDNSVTTSKTL